MAHAFLAAAMKSLFITVRHESKYIIYPWGNFQGGGSW
jgi:hypothetical protein